MACRANKTAAVVLIASLKPCEKGDVQKEKKKEIGWVAKL